MTHPRRSPDDADDTFRTNPATHPRTVQHACNGLAMAYGRVRVIPPGSGAVDGAAAAEEPGAGEVPAAASGPWPARARHGARHRHGRAHHRE
ncbi:hypothetical protein FRACA_110042 [Frankia canadensis]|uniref:Uncharacterized protein n=1 Tax=Frankia canadensis TaxID=1836972 RepID=A0A2I2KJ84_9ACTN|nr:hypothetical protein FRACA_110042 [Frankia canadensis]SOU53018.1 hypothetical protein FRACA_110042 [Frankia canadensis]